MKLLSTCMAGALLMAISAATQAKTLRVDDDGVQDRKAQHSTIQAAIDAARSGDIITVAPGIYETPVSISTPRITLKGAQSGRISASRQTNTPDPTIESVIVQNPNTTGVTIYADNITVDGFYLKEVSIFPGFTQEPAESTSGLRVQNNVFAISTNSFGGMLLLGLQSSTVTNNIFFSLDPPNAPAYRGIYSYGLLSNVSISNNIFSGMVGAIFILNSDGVEKNAAAASGKKKRRISVSINGNNFRYTALDPSLDAFPAYGVELADVTNAVIANNGFSAVLRGGSGYRGIVLANGVADTQVSNNLIYVNSGTPASSTSPVDVGIYVNNLPVEVGGPINVPTTGNVLQNNSIDGDLATAFLWSVQRRISSKVISSRTMVLTASTWKMLTIIPSLVTPVIITRMMVSILMQIQKTIRSLATVSVATRTSTSRIAQVVATARVARPITTPRTQPPQPALIERLKFKKAPCAQEVSGAG
jgi:hypothetical protein